MFTQVPRTRWRASLRLIRHVLQVLFILALVLLPGPLATLLSAVVLKQERRDLPAQVLHKE